ncbi:MAG: MFS transporter [Bifidobacterium sp.]|jgi:predicted MFS family arabinose efflux permease|nr:MFS transporter [Bifidobacterium sp.]
MKRFLCLSMLTMLTIGTDTFLVSPLIPLLSATMGFPLARGGWLVSAYAIGYCASALFAGPVSDRLDRRGVLIAGMAMFSLATTACGFATSFWMLFALRLATGMCAAIGSPQIWAMIPGMVPSDEIASSMAIPTAGLTIATLLGIPMGSFLSSVSTGTPFFAVGALGALATLLALAWAPHAAPALSDHGHGTSSARHHGSAVSVHPVSLSPAKKVMSPTAGVTLTGIIDSYATLFSNRGARRYFLAYLIFQTGNFAIMTFFATWFSRGFHLSQTQIGVSTMVIGAGNTLGAICGPLLLSRMNHMTILKTGFGAYVLVYALLPFSPCIAAACAGLTVTYAVGGVIFPIFIEKLQSLTTTQRGTVSTLTNVTMYAASTVAGIIGGPLLTTFPGFFAISALALSAMVSSLALWARRQASPQA